MTGNRIQYLERKEIDTGKWDACVNLNANGLIYAQSVFLDAMAVNWSAIVINNYEAIMPLPWRRKFGIYYYFKPAFIQQLGIIGNTSLADTNSIKEIIFRKIKYGTLLLNFSNEALARDIKAGSFANMVVDLSLKHSSLSEGFSASARRNINQSYRNELLYTESGDTDEAIDQYQVLYGNRMPSVRDSDFSRLKMLCRELYKNKMVIVRRVTTADGGLLSSALFLKDSKRIYNLLPSTSDDGRRLRANYFLMDKLLKEFEKKPLIFDFEGSDIKGIQDFYTKFGSRNEPYYYLNFNNLPWPLNLLKK